MRDSIIIYIILVKEIPNLVRHIPLETERTPTSVSFERKKGSQDSIEMQLN